MSGFDQLCPGGTTPTGPKLGRAHGEAVDPIVATAHNELPAWFRALFHPVRWLIVDIVHGRLRVCKHLHNALIVTQIITC